MNAVKTLCNTTILLENGQVIHQGVPKDVVDFYQNMILKKIHHGDIPVKVLVKKSENADAKDNSGISTGEVELISFKICNEKGEKISSIESEGNLKIIYEIRFSGILMSGIMN